MKASVEISMYPLRADYGTPILKFISRLRQNEKLEVKSNDMSTQIFGEYDLLMATLAKEMKRSFQKEEAVVMVMKILNG
ncbi:MAG TPA: hypothetical protein ENJ95_12740 [Bacteroidetes bacterium]|nr:hypothetical protein [Bacteroidota bacterium]